MSSHRTAGLYSALIAFWACCSGGFTGNVLAQDCSTRTIGSGSSTWEHPLRATFNNNRTQTIYLASEIGPAGMITDIAIKFTTVPGGSLSNWTIRMKHTTTSSYGSANLETADWTTVYTAASLPAGTTGWRTFTLATPFAYDGTRNLMIDFSSKDTVYAADGRCATFSTGVYRSVTRGVDGVSNPLTWWGTSGASRSNNVPQMILTFCGAAGPPGAPTGFGFSDRTSDSITWSWTRASANETGYYGHDASENVVWTAVPGSSHVEEDLTPNTQYTRHVHGYNANGTGLASNSASVYTLPVAPDISCDKQAQCPSYAINTSFTFSNAVAFGSGGVAHYHYVWDLNPGYTFTGTESSWASGTIQLTGNQLGNWYLHVASHNAEHAVGGMVDFGPFVIAAVPGYTPGDLDYDCDVDQADLDTLMSCAAGPGVAVTAPACLDARLDGDDDVDAIDFAIFQRCWSGEGFAPDLACENQP